MRPGKVAEWAPALCGMAHGIGSGDPRLYGYRLVAGLGALQQQWHAAPIQAPFPEFEPGGHLCKLPQVPTSGFPLPSA